mgnify:CR=1 FL=1
MRYYSWNTYAKLDYLHPELAELFALLYKGENNPGLTLADLSPLYSTMLHALPPLLVEYGECEVLHDQIRMFCRRVEGTGVSIQHHARADMTHVFPVYSFTDMPQCQESFATMVHFVNKCFDINSGSVE